MEFTNAKNIAMNKLFTLLILLIVSGLVVTSCYDPYRTDYDYTTVAFSTASGDANDSGTLERTVVKGEGLNLDFGVYLGGVIENEEEYVAEFEIDPSLLSGTSYEMMPDDYYTLSDNSQFIIPEGESVGAVTVELDSANFVNDPDAVESHYAIPFRLTSTSADSILPSQSTKILVIKYMSQYAGFYEQTGSFTTYDDNGDEINSGNFENVIEASTVMLDTVRTNGLINQRGVDYQMEIVTNSDNSVSLEYFPNPNPPEVANLAEDSDLSTSFVSGWESLEAVADGSTDPDDGKYGNWPEGSSWQWIEYEFPNFFNVESTDVYWFTDGGGLQPPTDSYVSYLPEEEDVNNFEEEDIEELPNSTIGHELDQYNTLEIDPPLTTRLFRINFIHDNESVGVLEWRAWGLPAPVTPEQAPISTLDSSVGDNSYNPSSTTFSLNYRVNFENGGYSVVESEMTWRNRIRDGVNEWRR
jgi:hypothetical protein